MLTSKSVVRANVAHPFLGAKTFTNTTFCGIFSFMTTNREKINEALFGGPRTIDVACAIITLDGEGFAPRLPHQFTVSEAIGRYKELRPRSIMTGGQVKESIDRMNGSPLGMVSLVRDARSYDEKTYALTSSPLWEVIMAYNVAIEQQFPGAADL